MGLARCFGHCIAFDCLNSCYMPSYRCCMFACSWRGATHWLNTPLRSSINSPSGNHLDFFLGHRGKARKTGTQLTPALLLAFTIRQQASVMERPYQVVVWGATGMRTHDASLSTRLPWAAFVLHQAPLHMRAVLEPGIQEQEHSDCLQALWANLSVSTSLATTRHALPSLCLLTDSNQRLATAHLLLVAAGKEYLSLGDGCA